ncbi:MAG: hypothetical protein R3F65_30605 [bacterium]
MTIDETRLDPETHRALGVIAGRFSTRNHITFLIEAATAAKRSPDDPLAALAVLAAMQNTAYADRPHLRAALADVGGWLEGYLAAHPALSGARLASLLGWVRRLAVANDKQMGGKAVTGDGRSGAPPRFGDRLLRGRVTARRAPRSTPTPATPAAPDPPPQVAPDPAPQVAPAPAAAPPAEAPPPDVWLVGCHDFIAAREVWKNARKRLAAGKSPKDQRIPLAVRAPAGAAGAGFEAGFAVTDGLVEVFRAVDREGGKARDFRVVAWDASASPWLATAVALE